MGPGASVRRIDGDDDLRRSLEAGRALLGAALPVERLDNRFDSVPEAAAMLHGDDGRLVGVAALYRVDRADGSRLPPWAIQSFVADPACAGYVDLLEAIVPRVGAEVWVRPDAADLVDLLHTRWPRAIDVRRLHLMAVDLPIATPGLPARPLDPSTEHDIAAVVRVNNAAFGGHPDQAGMTIESAQEKLASPGFSAAGVRLADIDGRINGFCWTQIHAARSIGEISVIGLHPSVHGRGLGGPMTAAGLHWLHGQGLDRAILYVEADNLPAVRTYERLGFTVEQDDVSVLVGSR